jgi:hypothetical protein
VLLVLVVTFSLYIYILKKQKRGKCPYQVFTYGTHVRVVSCSGLPGVLAAGGCWPGWLASRRLLAWLPHCTWAWRNYDEIHGWTLKSTHQIVCLNVILQLWDFLKSKFLKSLGSKREDRFGWPWCTYIIASGGRKLWGITCCYAGFIGSMHMCASNEVLARPELKLRTMAMHS